MKTGFIAIFLVLLFQFPVHGAEKEKFPNLKQKQAVTAAVDHHAEETVQLSDQVWQFAETALHETKSSALLADYLEKQGFHVERGVAGLPTAFVASYGQGAPVIAILGEYDALPGISQKAAPVKEPLQAGAAGHGCGHNLLGTASLAAAVAIKEQMQAGALKGTIRYYGTPAEEAVGGKIYMARAGLFKDVDVCLAWHPADEIRADTGGSQAIVDFIVEFHGKAAHAAFDPWNGRSAVDGLEIFTHALNMMREHVKPTVRIHYVIVNGGDVPNVVPEYAKLWCWVRDSTMTGVEDVLTRVRKMAEGSALAADVQAQMTIQSGDYQMLVNMPGEKLLQSNLDWLGPLNFTEEEQEFARQIQKTTGVAPKGLNTAVHPLEPQPKDPVGGSSDVGDVSWNVPVINLIVTTAPEAAPWHAWPVVACGGMSIGHKGLIYAAKAMSATMVDLFLNPAQVDAIRKDFQEHRKDIEYRSYIPDGPPPVPKE